MEANSLDVDHVVIGVRALDAGAELYRRLGFTLSPRGVHSAAMGTANHTIMLQKDYFELLTILQPTDRNRPWREALDAMGDGVIGMAVSTGDAAATRADWLAAGLAPGGVVPFSRPVERAGRSAMEARFETVHVPPGTLEGVGLFACRQFTPEAVWLPELTTHANTALAIARLVVAAQDPVAAAARWREVLGTTPAADVQGVLRLALPTHAVDFVQAMKDAPARIAEMVFEVESLADCMTALAQGGVTHAAQEGELRVASEHACGVRLVFVQRPA